MHFIDPGTGGFYKGKDPNVSIEQLKEKWIDDANVIYIGRAGGTAQNGKECKSTLRIRIKQYIKFGKGKNVGHCEGRYIWQMADSKELLTAYKAIKKENPVLKERKLIKDFQEYYGLIPFANLK
ncbi:hypothetical protein SAMN02745135_01988 [Caloranaerobacter azorensis DSM 13643]|uniref:Uncharacterized protein n=1 Tax=Caloranaerobacter azorensis DSM 13643 TaxID=1121264 RepID=A0A1M5VKW0_9FIRM|nr:hypothetical protein [Caloranaerobacter azorensis]SHH75818.1 hypothetical protein SAMN02745135_01988 [Caloranaerobacter azorensis DSM 13643]